MDPTIMTLISYLGVAILGGIVGYAVGRRRADLWEGRAAAAEDELRQVKKEARDQLNQLRANEAAMKKQIVAAQQEGEQIKKTLSQQNAQGAQVTTLFRQAETARDRAIEQANAHAQARQQAEARMKRAEQYATEMRRDLDKKDSEVKQLQASVQSLQPQGKGGVAPGAAADDGGQAFAHVTGSIDGILEVLVEREGQKTTVLADANGIVIAAAGDAGFKEGMAATAQLFSALSEQLDGMIPFDAVKAFRLQDETSRCISGRTFKCAGEVVALATYGTRTPSDRLLDGAMTSLNAALE